MDSDEDISAQLFDLAADMAVESLKLVPEGVSLSSDHPAARNVQRKLELFNAMAQSAEDQEQADMLWKEIQAAYANTAAIH